MRYPKPRYLVVCYGDDKEIVLATHRQFMTRTAAYDYAATIADSRCPIVVTMDKPLYEKVDAGQN